MSPAVSNCCQELEQASAPSAEAFEKARACFSDAHAYNEFVDCLSRLAEKNKSCVAFAAYYTALARYQQMKYLEEKQLWDEYFSQGNTYRDEITVNLQRALSLFAETDPLTIRASLLAWQFHKDQEDAFAQPALENLLARLDVYCRNASADMQPVRTAADTLLAYGLKPEARKAYALYIGNAAGSGHSSVQLQAMAADFLKNGNLELAETVYDALVNRTASAASKQELVSVLAPIAEQFAYKGEGVSDPAYAEKIFAAMEKAGGIEAFDEKLLYARAYNLQRYRDFPGARRIYDAFVARFPQSPLVNRAIFKSAALSLYALRDIAAAKEGLRRLSEQETVSPEAVASLYQLGLVSQWEEDTVSARDCFQKLLEKAQGAFPQTVSCARQRLDEIARKEPLEYRLKTFLDVSLKPENDGFTMARVEIRVDTPSARTGGQINVSATAAAPESGCMQVNLDYLWSLDLGTAKPSSQDASFVTAFEEPGPKIIGLVVITSGGVVDRSFEFIDIE